MTRKDYQLVANSLAAQRLNISTRSSIENRILDETIETLAATFSLIQDNFKKDIFMEAAGHGKNRDA